MALVIFLNLILLIIIIKNLVKNLKNSLVIKTNHVQIILFLCFYVAVEDKEIHIYETFVDKH
jgi:ATP/ADP translocase